MADVTSQAVTAAAQETAKEAANKAAVLVQELAQAPRPALVTIYILCVALAMGLLSGGGLWVAHAIAMKALTCNS